MHRYRKRPASMLISAILASIMFIIIANSFMNLWGNSFTTLTAAKTATQAQAYSDIVSEKIKLEGTDAEEVTTKTKLSEITGNDSDDDWFYTYEIENETEDDNGNIFKVASIKIYKDDENGPRYSTEIPLSSLGSSFSVPIGGIIAYTGSLNTLPLNYHLCDGTDGTPDLRDRFIVGAGSSYNLNTIGGISTNILALNQLPNLADFLNKLVIYQLELGHGSIFKKMKEIHMVISKMPLLLYQELVTLLDNQ